MKNNVIDVMKSKVCIRIDGNNIERFILRIHKNKIALLDVKKINPHRYEIIINYADFDKLLSLNTIYELKVIRYLGMEEKRRQILKYWHVLITAFVAIMVVVILSHMIFDVKIITNDNDMRTRLMKTLKQYDLSKYHFKKDYTYLQNVKENILKSYHDEIEWLEIETVGTRYVVRFEPRIVSQEKKEAKYQHVVAKKNAIIRDIFAKDGQIIKNKYAYVKKGDIIISGYIYLNDEYKKTVAATGKVYGEVWYQTKVKYPFNYYEEEKTGKSKTVYSVKLFNNRLELFNFHPFNDKIREEVVLLKSNVLPISLVKEKQEEVIIKSGMGVVEEVKLQAINLAYEKMRQTLKEDEYIISHHVIDSKIIPSGVEMDVFFSVYEDISDYVAIEEMKEVE